MGWDEALSRQAVDRDKPWRSVRVRQEWQTRRDYFDWSKIKYTQACEKAVSLVGWGSNLQGVECELSELQILFEMAWFPAKNRADWLDLPKGMGQEL